MASREQWFIRNVSGRPVSFGDLGLPNAINPGQKVDVLLYQSEEKVTQSKDLLYAVNAEIVVIDKIIDGVTSTVDSTNAATGLSSGGSSGSTPTLNEVLAVGATSTHSATVETITTTNTLNGVASLGGVHYNVYGDGTALFASTKFSIMADGSFSADDGNIGSDGSGALSAVSFSGDGSGLTFSTNTNLSTALAGLFDSAGTAAAISYSSLGSMDATNLTNLFAINTAALYNDAGFISGGYNPFNQSLNTSDSPTFATITAGTIVDSGSGKTIYGGGFLYYGNTSNNYLTDPSGILYYSNGTALTDGSGNVYGNGQYLSGITYGQIGTMDANNLTDLTAINLSQCNNDAGFITGNPFDQSLNTTDSPSFSGMSLNNTGGTALTITYPDPVGGTAGMLITTSNPGDQANFSLLSNGDSYQLYISAIGNQAYFQNYAIGGGSYGPMNFYGSTISFLTGTPTLASAMTFNADQTVTASSAFYPGQFATGSEPTVSNGAIIYDTTLNKLKVWTGAAWETITSL